MTKTVFVQAEFITLYEEVVVKVPTGETKRGFFGNEKQVTTKIKQLQEKGKSKSIIDGEKLSIDIQLAIEKLTSEGFDKIISITPIISGDYSYKYKEMDISSSRTMNGSQAVSGSGGYGFGYGFSYTEGVIIMASN